MRIIFVNHAYWPDYVATSQVLMELAEELVSRGHEIVVVCSNRPYAGGNNSFPKKECHNGVMIHRVSCPGWGKRFGTKGRLGDSGAVFVGALLKCMVLAKPDVVVTLTSPPLLGLVGRF